MPYNSGTKLPGETASKLGHLSVIESEWVRSLIEDFESVNPSSQPDANAGWKTIKLEGVKPLSHVWAVDGSFVVVPTGMKPQKEVAFVKTAMMHVDKAKLAQIDPLNPHPLLLKDIMADSALYHSTAFPLRNIVTSKGNNKEAIRNIAFESIKVDEGGQYMETLKWIAYEKWRGEGKEVNSPDFQCPHCGREIEGGMKVDSEKDSCYLCGKEVYLTDMVGFHLDMSDDSAPDSVASSYMLIMETLMLLTVVRIFWNNRDKNLVSDTLFIKDGPLTLRSQYSKLVPGIRAFLQFAKDQKRPVHIIGQEKSGRFYDHLSRIGRSVNPTEPEQPASFLALSHEYVRNEVNRVPDLVNPYGQRTNWGEKVYYKHDPGTSMVLNVPTGNYNVDPKFPTSSDLIGIDRILATIPQLISKKYEGALYPIELANGIASMSSYPSAKILERYVEEVSK
jgi:hypothetical protein